MHRDEVIAALRRYKSQLDTILYRFVGAHGDIYIGDGDHARLEQLVFEARDLFDDAFVDGEKHSKPLIAYFREGIRNFLGTPSRHSVEQIKNVISAALTRVERNPHPLKTMAVAPTEPRDQDVIVRIAERLHLVVHELRQRREDRQTLDVADEYDVQDLVRALLRLYFDDIRPEEWTRWWKPR